MNRLEDARELARRLVDTGAEFGVAVEAVISDMNQPLGRWVGNALEVRESIDILRGEADGNAESTRRLSVELAARMIAAARKSADISSAREVAERKLGSGEALEAFRKNIEQQGGDPRVCDDRSRLFDKNLEICDIFARRDGFLAGVDTLVIGNAVAAIGGGRSQPGEQIDHAVGFSYESLIGREIRRDDLLGRFYVRDAAKMSGLSAIVHEAFVIADEPVAAPELIKEVVSIA